MVDYVESNKKFMVGSVGSLKVFCMRGTRVPMDVVMDLKAVPKPLGPGSVHKGFYDRMDMVLSSFPLENSTSRVLVTGHSLGGGAAHCGYLMMKTLYPQIPVVCVTFGVPCAVSLEIQRAVEEPKEIVNFIDEGDYIPSITIDKYTSA
jgi:singapore isolate B (sub-type 7) whole genome shotgun sequence assembly, scaffold_1